MSGSRCFRYILIGLPSFCPFVLLRAHFALEVLHLRLILGLDLLDAATGCLILLLCQVQLVGKVANLLRAGFQFFLVLLLLLFKCLLFALQLSVDRNVLSLFEGQVLKELLILS